MTKRLLLLSTLISGLTACGITDYLPKPIENVDGLVTTIDRASSNKNIPIIADCLNTKLRENYPAASIVLRADSLYTGKIPGTVANQPIATFDLSTEISKYKASLTLKQAEPVDPAITDLFHSCL